ncbi:TonB-dependent receptor [Sandaracinobacter neustonicus]|uniref:TonB-dependent receptor n=1 Tax=Sandaracinobacter neustonicus TaxID=1715348 RepID=A0A501XE90_9SPHN|nr:TonB-dependent receptor [Sandaracinobacter neustonicus]
MLAGPAAFAQSTAAAETADTETIVVTGSLIKNPNLDRATPVTVTSADEINLKQVTNAEQVLRDIPGIVPSIGSAVNNGNGGASFVNLRGLGSNRNIVLLDGQRLVPAELNGRFDLNNIPLALIERVDVLTGGASTTYGADAVSGVVNFITRRDFTGVELNANYGLTQKGDGQTLNLDLTTGASFDDGRGNVTLSVGYQESDQVLQADRDFSRYSYDSFFGSAGGSGTSNPSRWSNINPTAGNLIQNPLEGAQICNVPSDPNLPVIPGAPNCVNPQGGQRQITADGTAFRPGTAYDAFNFNPYNVFQTPFKRFNIYAAGRYEVNENLEFYTRAIFSKNKVQTIIAPSGAFGLSVVVPLNNPFLTTAQRNAFCNVDINSGVGYTPRFTAAECAAAANPNLKPGDADYRSVSAVVSRRNVEGGPRISTYDTTFFDYQAGLRGAITSTIDYDVSGSYGESDNVSTADGYWLNSRVRQSMLANAAGCFDTSNGCVPLNLFGATGSITPAMNDFLNEASTTSNRFTLAQAKGSISGDFGVGSPLASDALAFAVGAEWRSYSATQKSDLLSQSGDLGGAGGAAPNISGGFNVYELFGEVIAPLVQDKPFMEDLTFEGGVRYSSYTVDAPTNPTFDTWTWKVGGSWSPGFGLKVRGNYAKAMRAPNIAELFSPVNTGLTNLSDDPCASLKDNGDSLGRPTPTGELLAICLAQGAPTTSIGAISVPTAGQANATFAGNAALKPEKSTSWTLGAVFVPQFAPGLSLTVDYYNIVVTDAITFPTPNDAIEACFGTGSTPAAGAHLTEACTSIRRSDATGSLSGDSAEVGGLFLPYSNLGRLETDGVDFTLNYGTDFGAVGWKIALTGNWTGKSVFQATPTSSSIDCVGKFGTSCGSIQPDWSWSVRNTFTISDFDISFLWRHLSSVTYEGAGDVNTEAYSGTLTGGNLAGQEVDFNHIPAYNIFDLSARFQASETFTFTFAISNLFDKQPKVVGNSIGSTSFNSGNVYPSTYDALGRRFNVGARIRF